MLEVKCLIIYTFAFLKYPAYYAKWSRNYFEHDSSLCTFSAIIYLYWWKVVRKFWTTEKKSKENFVTKVQVLPNWDQSNWRLIGLKLWWYVKTTQHPSLHELPTRPKNNILNWFWWILYNDKKKQNNQQNSKILV
jgi:hypothetical protein